MISRIKNNFSPFAIDAVRTAAYGGVAEILYQVGSAAYQRNVERLILPGITSSASSLFESNTLYRVVALGIMAYSLKHIWFGCRARGPSIVSIGSYFAGCTYLYVSAHKVGFLASCLASLGSYIATEKIAEKFTAMAKGVESKYFPSGPYVPKISVRSILDNKKVINRYKWAVTLVTVGKLTGHAMLIIEGIQRLEPFVEYAHLTSGHCFMTLLGTSCSDGFGKIELVPKFKYEENHGNNPLKVRSQSETWIRDYEDIEKIRRSISLEIKIQENNGQAVIFNLLGNRSILNLWGYRFSWRDFTFIRSHNCLTWAQEKLQLAEIRFDFSPLSRIASIPMKEV